MGDIWAEGRRRARRFRRQCCCPLTIFCTVLTWLFSWHLRDKEKKDSDDGHEHFVFLAGLVLTYGIALTLTEQGKGVRLGAIAVFSLVSLLTIAGIWLLLRCVEKVKDGTQRAFTSSTIRFGEWALAFSILVYLGFVIFAAFGILPGQQAGRIDYTKGTLPTTASFWHKSKIGGSNQSKGSPPNDRIEYQRQTLFRDEGNRLEVDTQQKNAKQPDPDKGSRFALFLVEQELPFEDNFNSFQLRFDTKQDYEVIGGFGVLISADPAWKKWRPVHLPREELGEQKLRGVFMLEKPDKGESLRLVIQVQTRDPAKRFAENMQSEDLGLELRKEGD